MTGAYIIIPINAQYSIIPNEALTIYSWPRALMKNTIIFAVDLLKPDLRHGKYICLTNQWWTGMFHNFQYSSKFLQFHQSL